MTRAIRLDRECNGNRIAVYGPMESGYRNLLGYADLAEYVPAWGTPRDTVMEWRLYVPRPGHNWTLWDTAPVDAFDTRADLESWVMGFFQNL